ncbi:A-kinase anchor protein 1, mitochondrial isoform X2 [Alligator sinensis]|uniref:A-kinase anchor protein 1, mitochondrial isoform X2 n=1 Tax=Alligator sinensis TaxID=38654 RepID=A0A3Q0H3P2_ALLSI|nr:A-kinase anchor protein 1, mitochondrial isoform X2 [Alligator sinensis]
MALRFRRFLPYALPGVLALIGWWWFFSRKKERESNHDRQVLVGVEEQRIKPPKKEPSSGEEPNVLRVLPVLAAEGRPENETFPPKPLLGSATPPPLSLQTLEGSDSSENLPATAMTAVELNTLDDDSDKLERAVSREQSGSPAQVSPPLVLESVESTSSATLGQQPLVCPALESAQEPFGKIGGLGEVETTCDSLKRPPRETQCPETMSVDPSLSPAPCPEPGKEADSQPITPDEEDQREVEGVDLEQRESEVGMFPNSCAESVCSEPSGKEMSESTGSTVPKCQGREDQHSLYTQLKGDGLQKGLKGDGLQKERTGGVSLDKDEVEKIEQVAIQIISKVILAATGEVLSGSVDPKDPQPKRSAHGEVPGARRTLVAKCQASLEESPPVMEDSGCSACTSEDGMSMEDPLQSTSLSLLAGQHTDSLSTSAIQDTSIEQSLVPSEKPATPKLPEDDKVPYSNGMLKEDSPDLRHERNWTTETDADHSGGSDVNSMDSVDSGCALGKTETRQNSKPGVESNKSELAIWEIEVPKHLVGRLIGKQGRYVSFLKQTSGAKIYISTLPYTQDFQICHIEGSQHHVDKALSLIGKKFKELNLSNIYAPPPPSLALHSLPMTSWLMLPDGVTVEVVVVNQVNAGHMFVQQHTHPTFHVLRSLDQQMYVCYSQPGIPTLPTPVEVGVICAAPGMDGAWWRAQVVGYFKDSGEVEIRYVDYGGYERVKIDTLRQIRSDFVTLPFQGAEVLLDNVVPLPDEDHFSSEADAAVGEMTRGMALLAQVTNYDSATGLPLIQLWSMMGDEVVSINRALVERGFAQWIDSY